MNIRWVRSPLLVALVVMTAAAAVAASPGQLDSTFNVTGRVRSSFEGFARDVLVDPLGRIVVAGFSTAPLGTTPPQDRDFLAARYNANGTALDFGFTGPTNDLGISTIDFEFGPDVAQAVLRDAVGRLVLVGRMVDLSVLCGSCDRDGNIAVARVTDQGIPDVTFDGDGEVLVGFGSDNEGGTAAALDADGRIIVVGYSEQGGDKDFAVARLNTNGTLDTTFSGDGKALSGFGAEDVPMGVAVDSQGRIVVVGITADVLGRHSRIAVVRYLETGALDASFGDGGKAIHPFTGKPLNIATGVAIDSGDGIIVGGWAASTDTSLYYPSHWEGIPGIQTFEIDVNQTGDFALTRLLDDGAIDTSFGSNGRTFTDFAGFDDFANAIGIDPQGRIILAGASLDRTTGENFAIARYSSNGVLDTTFGLAGRTTASFGDRVDVAMAVDFDPSNRIVAAGFSRPRTSTFTPSIAIARFDNGGTATVARLADLVTELTTAGAIDNSGVSQTMSSRLASASQLEQKGQPELAANVLRAFVHLVEAQRGKHIAATTTLDGVRFDPAGLLIEHAGLLAGQ